MALAAKLLLAVATVAAAAILPAMRASASNEINITASSRGAAIFLKNSLPIQEFRVSVVRRPGGANVSGQLGPVGAQAFFGLSFDSDLFKFTGFDTNQTYILPQSDFGDILDIQVNRSGNFCLSDFVLLNLEAQVMDYSLVTSQCVEVNLTTAEGDRDGQQRQEQDDDDRIDLDVDHIGSVQQ